MARHMWSVLCTKAIIDRDSNIVSLIGAVDTLSFTDDEDVLLERIKGEDAMGVQVDMELVMMWARSDFEVPEEAMARVSILAPSKAGNRVAPFPIRLQETTHFRVKLQVTGIPFEGFGIYYFVVETQRGKGWVESARLPLLCKKQATAPARPAENLLAAVPIKAKQDRKRSGRGR